MWEFYLAAAEMTFRYDREAVFQIQLSKRIETLPMTRDYMLDSERMMGFASAEQNPREPAAA
jgi:cyclopropane-fatty-acyl-phospholipid synthase